MIDLMNFQQAIATTWKESVERVDRCVDFVMTSISDNYDFTVKKNGSKSNSDDPLKKPFDVMDPLFDPDAKLPKAEPKKDQEPCPILDMTVINYEKPIISVEVIIPHHLHIENGEERERFDTLLKRRFHRFGMDTCCTKIRESANLHDIVTVDFTYDAYVPITEDVDNDFFKSRLIYAFGDTTEGIKKGDDPRPMAVMSTINAAVLIYMDEDNTFRVNVWKANMGRKNEERATLKYTVDGIEEYARAVLVARELCHLNGFAVSKPIVKMLHKKYNYNNGYYAYVEPKFDPNSIKYGMNEDQGAAIFSKNEEGEVMAQFDDTETANIISDVLNSPCGGTTTL